MASEVHPATLKFQLAIPRVVQSISPAIAALHVTRSRLIHSPNAASHTFDTTHCITCGTYLLGGTGSVRVVRKSASRRSGKPYLRVLRKSCMVCSKEQEVPVDDPPPGVTKQPTTTSVNNAVPDFSFIPTPNPQVSASWPLSTTLTGPNPSKSTQHPKPTDDRSKARAKKKKSGLSDMLARNKERQEKERSAGGSTGLAAFLQDL
ncbi:hypothetical protein BC835DRAFT_1412641 [Cytidiella melzeri]|nr:hypothetical protein BC835DRAFT_1412641 [Cytidiella melzeri]